MLFIGIAVLIGLFFVDTKTITKMLADSEVYRYPPSRSLVKKLICLTLSAALALWLVSTPSDNSTLFSVAVRLPLMFVGAVWVGRFGGLTVSALWSLKKFTS